MNLWGEKSSFSQRHYSLYSSGLKGVGTDVIKVTKIPCLYYLLTNSKYFYRLVHNQVKNPKKTILLDCGYPCLWCLRCHSPNSFLTGIDNAFKIESHFSKGQILMVIVSFKTNPRECHHKLPCSLKWCLQLKLYSKDRVQDGGWAEVNCEYYQWSSPNSPLYVERVTLSNADLSNQRPLRCELRSYRTAT